MRIPYRKHFKNHEQCMFHTTNKVTQHRWIHKTEGIR